MMKRLGLVPFLMAGAVGFALVPSGGASEWRVSGGLLRIHSPVQAHRITIGSSAGLAGSGPARAALDIAGDLAPAGPAIGAMTVSSSILFRAGSTYQCQAATHTSIDRIECADWIRGTCTVQFAAQPGAIPIHQLIGSGSAACEFSAFTPAGPGAAPWTLETGAPGELRVSDTKGDSDNDRLTDFWEWTYFANRTGGTWDGDEDEDGFINLHEQAAGTNPGDDGSLLLVTRVRMPASTNLLLSWSSESNRTYRVVKHTNICSAAGQVVVSGIPATPPRNTWQIAPSLSTEIFCIEVEP